MELRRDFFFEFAGMPKSGKTTTMDTVVHYLKRQGLKVTEYHGGGRYAPIDKSANESLNLYLAGMAVNFILQNSEREKTVNRLFIMDRGLFDRWVFTRALNMMNKIDNDEYHSIVSYLTISRVIDKIDGVFLFVTNPHVSIDRENKNKLTQKPGRVMNSDVLQKIRDASIENHQSSQGMVNNVFLIDTELENNKILETSQFVINKILETIGKLDG